MTDEKDIVEIVRPQSTGEAAVMISADKLHRICDELEQGRSNLMKRDKFIVANKLWLTFCAGL